MDHRASRNGSDSLSDIKPSDSDLGLMMTATTFFYFPGGNLLSRDLVTVQPVLHGSTELTHITDAVHLPSRTAWRVMVNVLRR